MSRNEVILLSAFLGMMLFVSGAGAASGELHEAPINPDFTKYIAENQSGLTVVGTQSLGLAPPPIYRPDVLDVQLFVPAAGEPAVSYPATFDLRKEGKMSPVKNQDPWGTCWAFATFGSLESTLMPTHPIPNFSEKNLVNLAGFDFPIPDGGGNLWMSTAYLVRWNGPVDDETDPYPKHTWVSSRAYTPVKHVQDVVFLPARTNRTDTGNLKGALTKWGAISTALYWYGSFYNETHTSYYQPASDTGVDHGHWVTIIGWDDTYEVTNFTVTADGPGAWLVKNSWGPEWGSEGCFYASYYDKSIGSAVQSSGKYHNSAVFLGQNISNYDTVYSYDRLGEVGDYWYSTPKTGSFANVFTANSSETLKAVGFYTTDVNVTANISIYKNPFFEPAGGTPVAIFNQTLPYMGYNTVVIPSGQQVPVTKGDKFSVVVQVTNPTNNYYIPIEKNSDGYTSGIVSQFGEGYVLKNTGWTDLKTELNNSHICLKAYAGSADPPVASFTMSPVTGSVPLVVNFKDTSTNNPTRWNWNFGEDKTSTFENPRFTYTKAGVYNVTLIATNSAGSSSPYASEGNISVTTAVNQSNTTFEGVVLTNQTSHDFAFNIIEVVKTGGSVTVISSTRVDYQPPGWQNIVITGTNISGNATFILADSVTSVRMMTLPLADTLAGVGTAQSQFILNQTTLTQGATFERSIIPGANASVTSQFKLAVMGKGSSLSTIGYTVEISGAAPFNSNRTGTNSVYINLSAAHSWVTSNGGTGSIRILHLPENGTAEVLSTTYTGGDGTTDYFTAYSDTLSIFGIGGVTTDSAPNPMPAPSGGDDNADPGRDSSLTRSSPGAQAGQTMTFIVDQPVTSRNPGAIITIAVVPSHSVGPTDLVLTDVGKIDTSALAGRETVQIVSIDIIGINQNSVSDGSITFAVSGAWLSEHGLSPANIVLMHNHDGTWTELQTVLDHVAGNTYYYVSNTPAFAYFAITTRKDTSRGNVSANSTGTASAPTIATSGKANASVLTFNDMITSTTVPASTRPTARQVTVSTTTIPAPVTGLEGSTVTVPAWLVGAGIAFIVILAVIGFLIRR